MRFLPGYILVFLGAGLGGALRHAVNTASTRLFGPDLPVGTFVVNIAGSLAMGLVAGFLALRGHISPEARIFATTGILGGFTTFSAFSLEAALLLERHQTGAAIAYATGSVMFSVAAVFAGLAIMRA